ncbi:MAG: dTMP kinase [Micromonosporaceae bacterium]
MTATAPGLRLPEQGALIVFCGIDGSGKTTQIARLAEHLRPRYPVLLTCQPTPAIRSDPLVRAYLDEADGAEPNRAAVIGPEIGLVAAADSYRHVRTEVVPRMQDGYVVLSDRYVFTNLAYAGPRGLAPVEWVRQINRYTPDPDLTLYLDVPAAVALSRIRSRGDAPTWEEQDPGRMEAIRTAFREQPWGASPAYLVLDGTQPPDTLAAQIAELAEDLLRRKGVRPIDRHRDEVAS